MICEPHLITGVVRLAGSSSSSTKVGIKSPAHVKTFALGPRIRAIYNFGAVFRDQG